MTRISIAVSAFVILFGSHAIARDLNVPADYPTLADALDVAVSGDTIVLSVGTYRDPFTLPAGVSLEGEEAAATSLLGTVTLGTDATLTRVTVQGGGIVASNTTGITVQNAIIKSVTGLGVNLELASDATVTNNTFDDCGTCLVGTDAGGIVRANIFVNSGLAIDDASATPTLRLESNHFNSNDDDGRTGSFPTSGDPLFVDPAANDYHLQEGSPCQDAVPALTDPDGTALDQGAYGGPGMDRTPFRVGGVTASAGGTPGALRVTWGVNLAYNTLGYRVYYGTVPRSTFDPESYNGTGASEGDSPIQTGLVGELELTGLAGAGGDLTAPAGVRAAAASGKLILTWDEVPGATGYEVSWGTTSGALTNVADVGDVLSFTITGLDNGTSTFAAVRAYRRTEIFVAVTSLATPTASEAEPPESRFSEERSVLLEDVTGPVSEEVSGTPEAVSAFPDLPSRGACLVNAVGAGEPPHAGNRFGIPWFAAVIPGLLALVVGLARVGRKGAGLAILMTALLWPSAGRSEEPRWSVHVLGGVQHPSQDDWGDYYDDDYVPAFKGGVGFRLTEQFEVGIEAGYWKADGKVEETDASGSVVSTLDQSLKVVPLMAHLLCQFHFRPDQMLVPYLAGGYSRYYYWQELDDGGDTSGYLQGYHGRVGLKLLVNRFDPSAADTARRAFGLRYTYLVIEAQYAVVDDFGDTDTDLGGWSYYGGFSMEF